MDDEPFYNLRQMQSYNLKSSKAPDDDKSISKSEVNVGRPKEYEGTNNSRILDIDVRAFEDFREYYKKYEHDEVPVKDSNLLDPIGMKGSLTNSELDKLEIKVFQNMSQELQTDEVSTVSLDSNIKFFKTTVLEIFENFYASMRDFAIYKKRFNEILTKNKEDAVSDMEDFIKDMIQHIMSSETLISNDSKKNNDTETLSIRDKDNQLDAVCGKSSDLATLSFRDKQTNISNFDDESSYETNNSTVENYNREHTTHSVIEAYKNDNYLTDSTLDDNPVKAEASSGKDEIFNIFLLSGNPCVQIKINERNLLSEINIKESVKAGKVVASADNIEKMAAKKMELENYVMQEYEPNHNVLDREIPVKVSYAKKNIYLNEDFSHERDSDKSFITKLCNFLCKKFRKTS